MRHPCLPKKSDPPMRTRSRTSMMVPFQFGRHRHNPCDARLARCSWRRQRGQESGIDVAMDQERRLSWRADGKCAAWGKGGDGGGRGLIKKKMLDNLRANGFYGRLKPTVQKGGELSDVVAVLT